MKKIDPAALTVPIALLAIFAACALAYVPLVQAAAAGDLGPGASAVASVEPAAEAFVISATTPAAAAR